MMNLLLQLILKLFVLLLLLINKKKKEGIILTNQSIYKAFEKFWQNIVEGLGHKANKDTATSTTNGLMSAADKSKLDGIATGANAYSLPAAGSSLGGVKTGGDVTISNGTITVNDDSHNHVISNIDSLQTTLDAKAPKASPGLTGTPTAPTAAAGTNTTQIATTAFVTNAVNSVLGANDAMLFKGTLGTGGTVTALPATHSVGWTYKVITAGTYAGITCEVGDMIICVADGTSANNAHWTVVQTNIDGAVIGPASSVTNRVATFNGTTGKIIKDSGYTIDASVPSGAKFTDTTYTFANGTTNGTFKVTPSGGSAQSVSIGGLGSAAYTDSSNYAPAVEGGYLPLSGGNITGIIDASNTSNIIDFGTSGWFRGKTTSGSKYDIFGYSNPTTLQVGGSYSALALKGKNTRPTYNNNDMALMSDVDKKVDGYNLEIYNGTSGNPKPVKFATFDYSTCGSENGISAKISMVSGHGNGTSYVFLQDAIINVGHTGIVTVDNFKYYGADAGTYDGAARQYGDIFWVIDTTNKIVDFYCLMGQYARVYQTPWKRLTYSNGGVVTQHTSCAVYSSGEKVWGNNSDIALTTKVNDYINNNFYTKAQTDALIAAAIGAAINASY